MSTANTSPLRSADWLRREYVQRGRSTDDIAVEVGHDRKTVAAWLRRHGIPVRPKTVPVVFPGERHGDLVVVEEAGRSARGKRVYLCRCDCGGTGVAEGVAIKGGSYRHCGQYASLVTHGHSRRGAWTSTYHSWSSMVDRCTNSRSKNWDYYGGRGITVYGRWRRFEDFLADMGDRPDWATGGIDRIDPDGNYEPGNCRWATRAEQTRNRRTGVEVSRLTVIRGEG